MHGTPFTDAQRLQRISKSTAVVRHAIITIWRAINSLYNFVQMKLRYGDSLFERILDMKKDNKFPTHAVWLVFAWNAIDPQCDSI